MSVTVKELIQELQMLPQNHIVILSSDAEGNNFHKLEAISEGAVDDPDSYYVVVLWP